MSPHHDGFDLVQWHDAEPQGPAPWFGIGLLLILALAAGLLVFGMAAAVAMPGAGAQTAVTRGR